MNYLHTNGNLKLFQMALNNPYYVDKSLLIEILNSVILNDRPYICITRPRRFGKSVNANMVASYYSLGVDSKKIFDNLQIGSKPDYSSHLIKEG